MRIERAEHPCQPFFLCGCLWIGRHLLCEANSMWNFHIPLRAKCIIYTHNTCGSLRVWNNGLVTMFRVSCQVTIQYLPTGHSVLSILYDESYTFALSIVWGKPVVSVRYNVYLYVVQPVLYIVEQINLRKCRKVRSVQIFELDSDKWQNVSVVSLKSSIEGIDGKYNLKKKFNIWHISTKCN